MMLIDLDSILHDIFSIQGENWSNQKRGCAKLYYIEVGNEFRSIDKQQKKIQPSL